ncbi:hypothetical protein J7I01_004631 [Vibrio parahaemolyticus]|nr:hypothetical protein [Vibrio parahaemolyticus]
MIKDVATASGFQVRDNRLIYSHAQTRVEWALEEEHGTLYAHRLGRPTPLALTSSLECLDFCLQLHRGVEG